jgi:hypothetical protein
MAAVALPWFVLVTSAVAAILGFAACTWLLWAAPWPWAVALAVGCGGVCFGIFFARFFSTLGCGPPSRSA